MMNGEQQLPDGWAWSTLDKFRKGKRKTINPAKSPKQEFELYSVPSFENRKPEIILGKEIGSSKQEVHKDEVLICKINPRINRSWVVGDYTNNPKIASTEWFVFEKSENLNPDYLCYFMQLDAFRDHLATNVSGVGGSLMRARSSSLEGYPFPLAPLPEQERIVAKIEELFTQLDAGTSALERVQAGLRRYKASVLKAAVEGRLQSSGHSGAVPVPGGLPEGWRWTTLGKITQHLTSGSRGWAKYYSEEGSLFVRVGNFNRLSNAIDLEKLQFVNAPDTAEANRTRLKKRDLLITMTADVGMVGIVDERTLHWDNAYINQHVGLVRLENPDYVDYVSWALASEIGQKQFREKQYGLTKVGLNFDDIRSLEIPLPPLEEQRRIVAEVERRLSVAREVESVVEKALVRASRLRQAVLKSAFEGRL